MGRQGGKSELRSPPEDKKRHSAPGGGKTRSEGGRDPERGEERRGERPGARRETRGEERSETRSGARRETRSEARRGETRGEEGGEARGEERGGECGAFLSLGGERSELFPQPPERSESLFSRQDNSSATCSFVP